MMATFICGCLFQQIIGCGTKPITPPPTMITSYIFLSVIFNAPLLQPILILHLFYTGFIRLGNEHLLEILHLTNSKISNITLMGGIF